MRKIRTSLHLLCYNIKSVFLFELSYKLMCIAIFAPVLLGLFNLSLRLAGFHYLSANRLLAYCKAPTTWLLLFLIVLGLTFVAMLEICAIIQCYHASYYERKMKVSEMYYSAVLSMYKFLKHPSIPLILFVIFILPFTNITILTGYFSAFAIPDFIMEYIEANKLLLTLFITGVIALAFLALRWCLSMHCFTLEHGSYKHARAHSFHLLDKKYLWVFLQLILWSLFNIFLMLSLTFLLCGGILLLIHYVLPSFVTYSSSLTAIHYALIVSFDIFGILGIPISFAYISSLYYTALLEMGQPVPAFHCKLSTSRLKKTHNTIFGLAIAATMLITIFTQLTQNEYLPWNQSLLSVPEITAHRGDSVNAPENTIPAFLSAIENQADCAELDVAETKDGMIVVLHDSNLKRVAGTNINIWDITYDELKNLDAGSYFDSAYAGTPIPTLDEVLKTCQGQIRLNIELKPTGHEIDYEKKVAQIIEDNDYAKDCVVASKNLESLKKIKSIDSDITTIYLMTVAYGNFYKISYIDGFSIESSFISQSMVNHVHDTGKVIYAWTINNENQMQKMSDLGVDSVVTDNPVKAREIFYAESLNDNIVSLIQQTLAGIRKLLPIN